MNVKLKDVLAILPKHSVVTLCLFSNNDFIVEIALQISIERCNECVFPEGMNIDYYLTRDVIRLSYDSDQCAYIIRLEI